MQLGPERCVLGVILALFHDVGYLRRSTDREQANGAEFTRNHVSRGAEFLSHYLPQIGLGALGRRRRADHPFHRLRAARSTQIVTHDARDVAPRASARHRRHGGAAGRSLLSGESAATGCIRNSCSAAWPCRAAAAGASAEVKYASGLDLLRQTPGSSPIPARRASIDDFDAAYRFLEMLFDGRNPYIEAIDRNMQYLEQVLRSESWRMLRRNPPLHAADPKTLGRVRSLMLGYFKKAWLQD